jgi:hypothetical protein
MTFGEKRRVLPGICLACWVSVSDSLAHEAPTVMWRMRRADGMSCHAVMDPRADGAVITWYLNGHVLGYRAFNNWTAALRWSDQLQAQNWTIGWRLVPEYDDAPDQD